jgi:hypothetical protein
VISITGHAYLGEDDKVYLAAKDFQFSKMAETGLPLDWLAGKLNACAAEEKILLLDVSPSGTGRDVKRQLAGTDLIAKLTVPFSSTVVILPCSQGEQSLISPEKKSGVFALAAAQGFHGAADSNRDLRITPAELYGYIHDALPPLVAAFSGKQTPVLVEPK